METITIKIEEIDSKVLRNYNRYRISYYDNNDKLIWQLEVLEESIGEALLQHYEYILNSKEYEDNKV